MPPEVQISESAVPTEWNQLDPRVIRLDLIVGAIVTVGFAGMYALAVLVLWVSAEDAGLLVALAALGWPFVTLAFAILSWKYPYLHYAHTSYRVDDEVIEIRTGVWWRTSINVPRSRVQHIDVSQGPLERRFALATLSMYTAGTQYGHVPLRGLAHAVALALRDQLLPKSSADGV
jgi:hypothetical protein